jgi:hypothetical protein
MGLANCPFFGVGMGEFFFLLIAVLLKMKVDIKTMMPKLSDRD